MEPNEIIERLRSCSGLPLERLPGTSGIYALRDHTGTIRYIGIAHTEGFRVRIRNKHATGSEDRSHKFSAAYNSGRLWRDRHDGCKTDGAVAKRLRNQFILKHCSASVVEIADYGSKAALEQIERDVISLASPQEVTWNGKFAPVDEPSELIDRLIEEARFNDEGRAALDRQKLRFMERAQ
ncbi:MAG: hypothetical protein ACEQR8_05830 [Cypionkella sp.]